MLIILQDKKKRYTFVTFSVKIRQPYLYFLIKITIST